MAVLGQFGSIPWPFKCNMRPEVGHERWSFTRGFKAGRDMKATGFAIVAAFALSSCASEPKVLEPNPIAQPTNAQPSRDEPCPGAPAIPDAKTAIKRADLGVGAVLIDHSNGIWAVANADGRFRVALSECDGKVISATVTSR